jgi:N6-L-threonylcarbamoyladenine synthase
MDIHARYGGVFPEVASRQHVLSIIPVVEETLAQSNLTLRDIDAVAVTRGPGLAGSLVVGMNMAKGIALGMSLPLIGVNHLEGHIYSSWIYNAGEVVPPEPEFPLMALLVSGGHTEQSASDHLTYSARFHARRCSRRIRQGRPAAGTSYPGGPSIQRR